MSEEVEFVLWGVTSAAGYSHHTVIFTTGMMIWALLLIYCPFCAVKEPIPLERCTPPPEAKCPPLFSNKALLKNILKCGDRMSPFPSRTSSIRENMIFEIEHVSQIFTPSQPVADNSTYWPNFPTLERKKSSFQSGQKSKTKQMSEKKYKADITAITMKHLKSGRALEQNNVINLKKKVAFPAK